MEYKSYLEKKLENNNGKIVLTFQERFKYNSEAYGDMNINQTKWTGIVKTKERDKIDKLTKNHSGRILE